jgi:hypothetical protein
MNNFYVYKLIDPRDGSEFYIGKGKGNRMYIHERSIRTWKNCPMKKYNPHLYHKISQILKEGFRVVHEKIAFDLSEEEAFALEKTTIEALRENNVNLCNILSGGEGFAGGRRKMTEGQKKAIGDALRGRSKDEDHKQKLSEAKKLNPVKYWEGKSFSQDHKSKLAAAKRAFLKTEEGRRSLERSAEARRERATKYFLVDGVPFHGMKGDIRGHFHMAFYTVKRKFESGEIREITYADYQACLRDGGQLK